MKMLDLVNMAKTSVKNGVKTDYGLKKALGTLQELQNGMGYWRKVLREVGVAYDELSRVCGEYALANPGCFGDAANVENGEIMGGDLVSGLFDVHYLHGTGEFKRASGEKRTQPFLEGLPKGWTKKRLEIDTSGIKKQLENGKVTEADLAEHDLTRTRTHEWSWSLHANAMKEGGDVGE